MFPQETPNPYGSSQRGASENKSGMPSIMNNLMSPFMACWQPPMPCSPTSTGCFGQARQSSQGTVGSSLRACVAPQMPESSIGVQTPHPNDVLCGRGGSSNRHVGNLNFRSLVAANKEMYTTLTKKQKMMVARTIVKTIKNQNPPGRFLQKDPQSGLWFDIGLPRSLEKTSQALREKTSSTTDKTADKASSEPEITASASDLVASSTVAVASTVGVDGVISDNDDECPSPKPRAVEQPSSPPPPPQIKSMASVTPEQTRSPKSARNQPAPPISIPSHLEAQFNPSRQDSYGQRSPGPISPPAQPSSPVYANPASPTSHKRTISEENLRLPPLLNRGGYSSNSATAPYHGPPVTPAGAPMHARPPPGHPPPSPLHHYPGHVTPPHSMPPRAAQMMGHPASPPGQHGMPQRSYPPRGPSSYTSPQPSWDESQRNMATPPHPYSRTPQAHHHAARVPPAHNYPPHGRPPHPHSPPAHHHHHHPHHPHTPPVPPPSRRQHSFQGYLSPPGSFDDRTDRHVNQQSPSEQHRSYAPGFHHAPYSPPPTSPTNSWVADRSAPWDEVTTRPGERTYEGHGPETPSREHPRHPPSSHHSPGSWGNAHTRESKRKRTISPKQKRALQAAPYDEREEQYQKSFPPNQESSLGRRDSSTSIANALKDGCHISNSDEKSVEVVYDAGEDKKDEKGGLAALTQAVMMLDDEKK